MYVFKCSLFFIIKFQVVLSTKELNAYAKAANIVEEVLSGIRTVFAFGGEKIEVERYKKHLQPAEKMIERKGIFASVEDASMRLLYFISCALSFWFGVQWVLADRDKDNKAYTIPVLITVILIKFLCPHTIFFAFLVTCMLSSAHLLPFNTICLINIFLSKQLLVVICFRIGILELGYIG